MKIIFLSIIGLSFLGGLASLLYLSWLLHDKKAKPSKNSQNKKKVIKFVIHKNHEPDIQTRFEPDNRKEIERLETLN